MGHTDTVALLLLLVGTAVAINRPPDSICDGRPVGYFAGDVRQCNAFLRCNQPGTPPTWGTCQTQGSVFSETHQACVWAHQTQCFACPAGRPYALLAAAGRCEHFVQCIDEEPQQFECGAGLHFDALRSACDIPERARCGLPAVSIPCPAVDNPTNRMWWRDSNDCSRYAVCVNGRAEHGACAVSLGFNMDTRRCDFREVARCDDGGGPTPEQPQPFSCAAQETLPRPIYPHPTDCQRYYICDMDNNAFPRVCPADTRFDIVQQVCDSIDRAVCAPGARAVGLLERMRPAEPRYNETVV